MFFYYLKMVCLKNVFKYFYMICNPMFFYYLKNGLSEIGSIFKYSYMHIYIYICSTDRA